MPLVYDLPITYYPRFRVTTSPSNVHSFPFSDLTRCTITEGISISVVILRLNRIISGSKNVIFININIYKLWYDYGRQLSSLLHLICMSLRDMIEVLLRHLNFDEILFFSNFLWSVLNPLLKCTVSLSPIT